MPTTVTRDEIQWDGDRTAYPMPPELPAAHWIADRRLKRMLNRGLTWKQRWRAWRLRHRANRWLLWACDFHYIFGWAEGHSWFVMTPFFQLTIWNRSPDLSYRRGLFTGYELRWFFNDGVLQRESGEWIFVRSVRSVDVIGSPDEIFFGGQPRRWREES